MTCLLLIIPGGVAVPVAVFLIAGRLVDRHATETADAIRTQPKEITR